MQERRKCLTLREVDRKNGSPPFEQIARMLRSAITSGELRCGDRLPTETKLAEQCGVARTTVRRAVQELRRAGLVVPTSGRGLRVARSPNASADALWPQQLSHPTRPATPNPTARGALIAQAEDIHRGMAVLAEEIKAAKPIDDPGVLAHLMTILADIASAQARILATLAIGLRANYATEGR